MQVLGQLTPTQMESFEALCKTIELPQNMLPCPLPPLPLRAGMLLDHMMWVQASESLQTPRWEGMSTISVGPAQFHIRDLLWTGGTPNAPIKLTEKERDLIMALYLAVDHSLCREDLLAQVWGYRPDLDTHTLETHIYRLRHKIEADPAMPKIITTIPNGYQLAV